MGPAPSKVRAIAQLSLGLAISTGCGEDEPNSSPATCAEVEPITELPDIPLAYATENLDIHVADNLILCAGSAQEYERFYQHVAAQLAIEPTQRVPVYVMNPGSYCTPGVQGCRTWDGVVFALPGTTHHELVHASSCEWRFTSAIAWGEGLAVALEPFLLAGKSDPREFITATDDQAFFAYYDDAGHFVRWLLEERGPEAFRELYRASPSAGGEAVLDVLEGVYGQTTASLLAEYEASAPDVWVPHRQCADVPVLTASGGAWEFEATFDCQDSSTLGPYERHDSSLAADPATITKMYQSFLIEVETAGSYRFTRDEVSTGIDIERCLDVASLDAEQVDSLWYQEGLVPTLQGTSDIDLTPGSYRIDVLREHAPPHPVWLRIEPTPG